MAKALKEVAKSHKLIPDAYLFFFTAIVLNYVWMALDKFMSTYTEVLLDVAEAKQGLVPYIPDVGIGILITAVVWLLSLYSLYILFAMVRKKERFGWSLGLLVLGALFYLMTIFF